MRDLRIQLIDPGHQTARSLFTLGFNRPSASTGIELLIFRWLKTFMTPKGTNAVRRTEGTRFPNLIRSNVAGLDGVQPDILDAIDDATQQVKAADALATYRPADERLLSVSLTSFVTLPPDGVEFWVELRSLTGVRRGVLIPGYAPG